MIIKHLVLTRYIVPLCNKQDFTSLKIIKKWVLEEFAWIEAIFNEFFKLSYDLAIKIQWK